MASVPAVWDRNSVDRLFTEIVGDLCRAGDRRPSEVSLEAKERVISLWKTANPGGEVPAYLSRLAMAPESMAPSSDLDSVSTAGDLEIVTSRSAELPSSGGESHEGAMASMAESLEDLCRLGAHDGECDTDERGICEKHQSALRGRLSKAREALAQYKS